MSHSRRLPFSPSPSGGPVSLFDQDSEANPAVRDVALRLLISGRRAVLVAQSREPRLFEAIDLRHSSLVDDDLDGAEAKVFDLLPDHIQPIGRRNDVRF